MIVQHTPVIKNKQEFGRKVFIYFRFSKINTVSKICTTAFWLLILQKLVNGCKHLDKVKLAKGHLTKY